jgi:inhibitor of KinA
MDQFPRLRPVADTGVLVEFGDHIGDEIHARVLAMDHAVLDANITGVTELIPAYAALLVQYDPLITNYATLCEQLTPLLGTTITHKSTGTHWKIPVCYDAEFAPDLPELASALGQSPDFVTTAHASAIYKVYMYGFAPGYAYLGGVPNVIQHPRKSAPTMGVPPQSAMIAGSQALITTVTMPSGWWVIGRSGINPLRGGDDDPFMLAVGDTIGFEQMSRVDFDKYGQGST